MGKVTKIALITGGIVFVLLIVASFVWPGNWGGQQSYRYGMGPWMMGGFGGMWFMPILMIVFWGLVIWGVVVLVRRGGCCGFSSGPSDSALEILKRRYARGEISKEEFEEKKKDLI